MQFDEDAVATCTEAQHSTHDRSKAGKSGWVGGGDFQTLGHAALTTASPFSPVPYCTLIILTNAAWTC
jgi:hypothetical protein